MGLELRTPRLRITCSATEPARHPCASFLYGVESEIPAPGGQGLHEGCFLHIGEAGGWGGMWAGCEGGENVLRIGGKQQLSHTYSTTSLFTNAILFNLIFTAAQ